MVRISDATLKQKSAETLSFKEKIELVRILDRLQTDVIELGRLNNPKADVLYMKTVSDAVTGSTVSVQAYASKESIDLAWSAVERAQKARIQITAPVSLVQMEYICHKKPEAIREAVKEAVTYAKTLCADVEFEAEDATRAEKEFLYDILEAAIQAGASTVTVCDTAGNMLADECAAFVKEIMANVPSMKNAVLAVSCSDQIAMADACTIASAIAGAGELKTAIYPDDIASLKNVVTAIQKKGADCGLSSDLRSVELKRLCDQAESMFTNTRSKTSPFENGVRDSEPDRFYTANDDIAAITAVTKKLGYDLTEEDQVRVYDEFKSITEKKEQVSEREIDAIIASAAMQVPQTYTIDSFIINSSDSFASSAHIRLKKNGELLESVALGDGPVDAAFLAIEQIIGIHYELDDFQIRAVTEGREAMGETIVRLRSAGKVYSGRGLSTDIIGSSISAYISALNKITFEEA